MLQDDSTENEATWEFLDRRIDNVLELGKMLNQNKNLASAVQTGLTSIFSILKPTKFDDVDMLHRQQQMKSEEKKAENDDSKK